MRKYFQTLLLFLLKTLGPLWSLFEVDQGQALVTMKGKDIDTQGLLYITEGIQTLISIMEGTGGPILRNGPPTIGETLAGDIGKYFPSK